MREANACKLLLRGECLVAIGGRRMPESYWWEANARRLLGEANAWKGILANNVAEIYNRRDTYIYIYIYIYTSIYYEQGCNRLANLLQLCPGRNTAHHGIA